MRRALALTVVVVACGGAAPPVAKARADAPTEPSIVVTADMGAPHAGDVAPDFELVDQGGARVKLSSLRGSVVMLAFVASWCPFSEAEQPNLARLAEDYRGKNVKVLAVDIKEADVGYRKYLDRVPMPFPVLHDATGDVTLSFAPPRAQPDITDRATVLVTSNLVLDTEGKIRFFTMVDTAHFDAKLAFARKEIDQLLAPGL